ncbi:MAG: transcriptional regulator [Pseudonocardiaceae bacterium]
MDSVIVWTGRTACALQAALRLTNESFAEHLGIAVRTVAAWHHKPTLKPKSEMQQLLDTALEQASPAVTTRFTQFLAGPADPSTARPGPAQVPDPGHVPPSQHAGSRHGGAAAADVERRLNTDRHIDAALDWLDRSAGWAPGASRGVVASRLARLDVRELHDRRARRRRVNQHHIAHALAGYYRKPMPSHGRYTAHYGRNGQAATSILTCPEWLDLDCPLLGPHDRLTLADTVSCGDVSLSEQAADHAAQRLVETLAMGTRFVDTPLYRLLDVDVTKGHIAGTVGVVSFAEYALTMDLLEGELIDAIPAGFPARRGVLPLRDTYLPDAGSVLDMSGRVCVGGVLALCAIARPASPHGAADYLLIVQERSGLVINATRTLAVIPKGFHQPLTDIRQDTPIGCSLQRETEEELFGRDDLDNTVTDQRSIDPMHPSRLSEPMRWLTRVPGTLRMECTGFGLNLVSGNYEFASLIVIDDEEFWAQYGGQIEANWESSALRRYSSLDSSLLTELVGDVAWSNEGLFALLQGLRRLSQIGEYRVNLPAIDWETRP